MALKAVFTWLFGVFLMLPANINAQNCHIHIQGKILDRHNGETLPFASIYIEELQTGMVGDSNAFYRFNSICEGTYTFIIRHLDCENIYQKIKINKDTVINFYPEHHENELSGFVITGKSPEENYNSSQVLDARKLEEKRGLNLGEMLKEIPGINTLKTGSGISKPMINGLHSNRIVLMNNGVKLESQQWGSEHAPEVDPFLASEIEVVKGASGIRYGSEAIGGTILLNPGPLRDSAGIGGVVNSVSASNGRSENISGILNGKISDKFPLQYRVQGSLKKQGNIKTPTYYLGNTGTNESNFSVELAYQLRKSNFNYFHSHFYTELGIFTGSHIGNLTDLQAALDGKEPAVKAGFTYQINRPYQLVYHDLDKLKYSLEIAPGNEIDLTFSRQYNLREEYDKDKPLNDSLAAMNLPELHLEITSYNGNIHWKRSYRKWKTELGTDLTLQKNTYEGRFFIPNYTSNAMGAYAIQQYKASRYSLEAGIRADQKHLQVYKREIGVVVSPVKDFSNIAFSLSGNYRIDTKTHLFLNIGNSWRAPQVNELYSNGLHHGAAAIETGNDNLQKEKAWQASLDIDRQYKRWHLNAHGFIHYINDYIYLAPTLVPTLTIRGAFPTFNYTQTDAFYRGIDAEISYRISSKILITEKISVLRTTEIKTRQTIINTPSDHFVTQLKYSFKNTAKYQNSYVKFSMEYTAKQWRVNPALDYAAVPPSYFLFHLDATSDVKIFKQNINIGMSIQNLSNKIYRDYLNRFRYYSNEMGRNYTLRIKIPFG